jgi:hypothetical protein
MYDDHLYCPRCGKHDLRCYCLQVYDEARQELAETGQLCLCSDSP